MVGEVVNLVALITDSSRTSRSTYEAPRSFQHADPFLLFPRPFSKLLGPQDHAPPPSEDCLQLPEAQGSEVAGGLSRGV